MLVKAKAGLCGADSAPERWLTALRRGIAIADPRNYCTGLRPLHNYLWLWLSLCYCRSAVAVLAAT